MKSVFILIIALTYSYYIQTIFFLQVILDNDFIHCICNEDELYLFIFFVVVRFGRESSCYIYTTD